ncbi:MAG: DUF1800 domain-containing protein [Mycobacteriales bacterium]
MVDAELAHLWRRAGFGARPEELAGSYDAALNSLLTPGRADSGVARTPPPDLGPEPVRAGKDATGEAKAAYRKELRRQNELLLTWWLDRMVAARQPFAEKMTFFWHGHFATSVQKVRSARLMQVQNATLRELGRGGFGSLARAMVRDPAMLVWLDGPTNRKASPNENLGRELMELFTLGHGHYTDEDVKAAARALTGWRVDRRTGTAHVFERAHDEGAKTLLGTTAAYDDQSLVDLLVGRPESAGFVVGRLWGRFVSPDPPSAAVADRLVAAYGPGLDITGLMRAMLGTEEFRKSRGALAKSPVELLVGALRAFDLQPSVLPVTDRRLVIGVLRSMGQVPFRPPSVGGWPAGRAWLGTSAAAARLRLGRWLAEHADLTAVARSSPASRVDALAVGLSVESWTTRTRAVLADAAADPKRLLTLAVASPEYAVA